MKNLNLTKKSLLSAIGALVFALPLLSGVAVQQAAFAQASSDQTSVNAREYLPIVKVAPVYPARAAARGLEGYVVVQYTVAQDGSTKDVTALESTSTLFERSAIESAMKYKYQPRTIEGTPVEVAGVTTRIEFVLEDEQLPVSQAAQEAAAATADEGAE